MNKDITIARRFSNLLEAVTELNIDLSYNRELAIGDIKAMARYQDMKVTAVFSDTEGQLWYIIRSISEGLNLLHKYTPFHSCLSGSPFEVYAALNDDGKMSALETATRLHHLTQLNKDSHAKKLISNAELIAG